MIPRNCGEVINQMLEKIPTTELDLRSDLDWNREDASWKAPEETIQWQRTSETLMRHIPHPTKDWQFEVLSIFSTMTVDEIKAEVNRENDKIT